MNLTRTEALLNTQRGTERPAAPKRTTLFIRADVRDRMKRIAETKGVPLFQLTEAILLDALDAIEEGR
jgi:hypothetical protein